MYPLITQALDLNNAFGTIGGGMQSQSLEPAQTAISRASQRIHDLAGGVTGDFDVSLGGSQANYVYIGVLCIAIFILVRGRK